MRTIGTLLWRFMVIFSFIVNIVLVVILLLAGLYIFEIKKQVAEPLIGGLHSTAAGLGDATIDWVIPVRDTIPVVLNIPLETNTTVVLTSPVPLTVDAVIDLPSILGQAMNDIPATVQLTLPVGLQLPVSLDLDVPVNEDLDIALDVRAVIPLRETQLIDPINQLGLLFEPLAIGLHNLPNDFGEAGQFGQALLNGADPTQLLLSTDGSGFNPEPYDPWIGYSQTAGLNYSLFNEQYPLNAQSQATGIVVPGGIPLLDALLPGRPNLYVDGSSPADVNAQAIQSLDPNMNPALWNGTMADYYNGIQASIPSNGEEPVDNGSQSNDNGNQSNDNGSQPPVETEVPPTGGQEDSSDANEQPSGIIPPPTETGN
jgi:hypothetical protein